MLVFYTLRMVGVLYEFRYAVHGAGAEVFQGGKAAPDGKWLVDFLRESGVNTDFVSMDGSATGNAVIQVAPSGENCIIINHGANY